MSQAIKKRDRSHIEERAMFAEFVLDEMRRHWTRAMLEQRVDRIVYFKERIDTWTKRLEVFQKNL